MSRKSPLTDDSMPQGWHSLSDILFSPSYLNERKILGSFIEKYEAATTYFEKLRAIRSFYKGAEPHILELGRTEPRRFFLSAYPIDWISFFSPIENDAWCSIRYRGIVMYPQYPVLNYYVDFGNPTKKIAIEVDGKAFHSEQKDRARDMELLKAGWTVYRIPGGEMRKTGFKTWADVGVLDDLWGSEIDALNYWLLQTGDGVIEAIAHAHFWNNQIPNGFEGTIHQTLSTHRLIS